MPSLEKKIKFTVDNKKILFDTLKAKGAFWSYSKMISYEELGKDLLIEHVLKFGDFDDLINLFNIFNNKTIENVWKDNLISAIPDWSQNALK